MAMQINAGKTAKLEGYHVDPAEIEAGTNGRWEAHDDEAVAGLVSSYEKMGQIEPVECYRRETDKRLVLSLGYRRWAAARAYNAKHPEKPMTLKVLVRADDPKTAFLRNIEENRERKSTTVVDDAFNQKRLREEFGMTDKEIAAEFDQHPSHVSRLKKLTGMRPKVLKLIHKNVVPAKAAFELAEMDPADQDGVLKRARIDGYESMIADLVAGQDGTLRETQTPSAEAGRTVEVDTPAAPETKPEATPTPKPTKQQRGRLLQEGIAEVKAARGKKTPRTLKQVKNMLTLLAESDTPGVKALAGFFLDWVEGEKGMNDAKLTKRIAELVK